MRGDRDVGNSRRQFLFYVGYKNVLIPSSRTNCAMCVWNFPHIPVITSPPTRSSISLSFKPVDSPG